MLDEKDIQIIAKLMDEKLDQQKQELRGEVGKMLDQQKQELRGEFMTVIESEVTPKLRLLAEGQEAILEKMVQCQGSTPLRLMLSC